MGSIAAPRPIRTDVSTTKPGYHGAMKLLALLALLIVAPLLFAPDAQEADRWLTDLDAAHELSLKSGKPLLLAFR